MILAVGGTGKPGRRVSTGAMGPTRQRIPGPDITLNAAKLRVTFMGSRLVPSERAIRLVTDVLGVNAFR
jgi:hypothetical protein